jgi:hypothetical protein
MAGNDEQSMAASLRQLADDLIKACERKPPALPSASVKVMWTTDLADLSTFALLWSGRAPPILRDRQRFARSSCATLKALLTSIVVSTAIQHIFPLSRPVRIARDLRTV